MAILLTESKFTDIYGNITNEFKANAGDRINVKHTFQPTIEFISSVENQLKIDKLEKKITRSQGSFLKDGFRPNQTYTLNVVNNTNSVANLYSGTIESVSDLTMTMNGLPNLNNWTTGIDYIAVIIGSASYDSLNFAFNFIDNESTSSSLESIIDQETSRFVVNGLATLSIGSSLNISSVGKKSGQFLVMNPTITRLSDFSNPFTAFSSNRKQFQISFDVIFPAMFSESSFVGKNCLRYYSKSDFKILSTETISPTSVEYTSQSNTGLWDEGFNSEEAQCTSASGVNSIYYNKINTLNILATCPASLGITNVELGAMYITLDDEYNLNKPNSQDSYLPFVKTDLINNTNTGDSWTSSSSHPFTIVLNSLSYSDSGGVRTFSLQVVLNPFYSDPNAFGKFIDGRGSLDRKFYLWIKVGNTNRLLFSDELEFQEPVGVLITPDSSNFINHNNNLDYINIYNLNTSNNSDFNIEDDVAFIAEFPLMSADVNESVSASVVVKNLTTDFEFLLDKISFDLSTTDLQYFKDKKTQSINNLPNSSKKKQNFLIRTTPLVGGEITVRLFYPIVIDWKYWIEVFSTHPFFDSINKNNENWYNYNILPWKLFVKVEVKRNGVTDYFYNELNFVNYDQWSGTSTIKIYDATETKEYNSIQENQKMLIKVTHVFPSNYEGSPWGMITIEPKESEPRFILSTEIDNTQFDNPLIGISNTKRCDIQYLSPTTIVLRCFVQTNMLEGNNFCISSKISEDSSFDNNTPENNKLTEAGIDKVTESNQFKYIE